MDISAYLILGRNPFNAADIVRAMAERAIQLGMSIDVADSVHEIPDHPGVGLIMSRINRSDVELARQRKIPSIALFDQTMSDVVPVVVPDEQGLGKIAAEHLLDIGFKTVSFCGPLMPWSEQRFEGFKQVIRGSHAVLHEPLIRSSWEQLENPSVLRHWIENLPMPIGVMCANDKLAVRLRNALFDAGRSVPEDVAIVGVDNDELRSRYGRVSITSIGLNAVAIGARAAELLAEMIRHSRFPPPVTKVPPGRIFQRRSTDVWRISDPDVLAAVQFIASRFRDGIQVEDVLAHVMVSRSTLDRRMKLALGRSCSDEIERIRLSHAKRMLTETDASFSEIAAACGFNYLSHFSHAFRQKVGMSPTKYRKLHRFAGILGTESSFPD